MAKRSRNITFGSSEDGKKAGRPLKPVIGIRLMANTARQLESKVLQLPARQRARLAEWAEEAERRLDELRAGAVKGRPAASVFRKARSALR